MGCPGVAFRLRQHLKGSLWVVPFIGAALGPLLGLLVNWLDDTVQVPEAWRYSASTASGVLTVIIGAMVALLGFVVTIGVLVVQQATGTLSPRFMRLWYRDLLQKIVLATFVGTLTHRSVGDFVPTGATVVEILGMGPFPGARRLRRMVALGGERTIEQDPAFALSFPSSGWRSGPGLAR